LDSWYTYDWVYSNKLKDWVRKNKGKVIKEYCYLIKVTEAIGIKVYSSVDKRSGISRPNGEDSIKVVAARIEDLKPVRPKYSYIQRVDSWKKNLTDKLIEVKKDILKSPICERCGSLKTIKTNSKDGSKFYGCPRYPICNPKQNDSTLEKIERRTV